MSNQNQRTPRDRQFSTIVGKDNICLIRKLLLGAFPSENNWQQINGANTAIDVDAYGTTIDLQGASRTHSLVNGRHKGQMKIIRVVNSGEGETPQANIDLATGTYHKQETANRLELQPDTPNGMSVATLIWSGVAWIVADLLSGDSTPLVVIP